jgi:2,4-dienoyl-CoA reductase-like NADH-dependent reductase (Old Yellow Enzyme family)
MMNQAGDSFPNRIFRSATFEGMADASGFPTADYLSLYQHLASSGVKNIITGCTFVSQQGKMVQPLQAGIDSDELIEHYQKVTDSVHCCQAKIYLQISHAGRQTSSSITGKQVVGASEKRSRYFRSKPQQLSCEEIAQIIDSYAAAALRAKLSGFDGIQLHAAHGYLIHQFLHPDINNRKDEYGINPHSGIGDMFLHKIVSKVREQCGDSFPILVKISAADDLPIPFAQKDFGSLIAMLDREQVSAIEISYGTMENALNIFRGQSIPFEAILRYNFRYKIQAPFLRKLWKLIVLPVLQKRVLGYSSAYNLQYARFAKSLTRIPIICVGGFRTKKEMLMALEAGHTDFVSLCRPFICEPEFLQKLIMDSAYKSKCINCNICAIMCDAGRPTRCYR